MIDPKTLKGFNDALPEDEIKRKKLIRYIEDSLALNGFVPIDTPVLEYLEVLLGKGGQETDKQMFSFEDAGERKVGMRYDLTVPLARYVAQHENELVFPFKRYHIAKVWRGEKPQKGRFREFYQADFDIIGSDSYAADGLIIQTVIDLLELIGIDGFQIQINDRALLKEIFIKLGLEDKEADILKIVDKLDKIGKENVCRLLSEINIPVGIQDKLFDVMHYYENSVRFFDLIRDEYGIENSRLESLYSLFRSRGLSGKVKINSTITRGLDYYTGFVFETFLLDGREYGSICSGGGYANLTGLFSKNVIPGVGGSIGLDRILAFQDEKGLNKENSSAVDILIINFNVNDLPLYYDFQQKLKQSGLKTEVYLDSVKLGKQFKYADRKKIPYCMIVGDEERKNKTMKMKNMISGEEKTCSSIDEFINLLDR